MEKKRGSIWVLWLVLVILLGGVSSLLAYLALGDYRMSDHSHYADSSFARYGRSGSVRDAEDYAYANSAGQSQRQEALVLGTAAAFGFALGAGAFFLMVRARRPKASP